MRSKKCPKKITSKQLHNLNQSVVLKIQFLIFSNKFFPLFKSTSRARNAERNFLTLQTIEWSSIHWFPSFLRSHLYNHLLQAILLRVTSLSLFLPFAASFDEQFLEMIEREIMFFRNSCIFCQSIHNNMKYFLSFFFFVFNSLNNKT